MKIKNSLKETKFGRVNITLPVETYVCPRCGFEAATIESTGAIKGHWPMLIGQKKDY